MMAAEKKKHNRAIVRISHEFLKDLLFPKDAEILMVSQDPNDIFGRGDFVMVVEHPDLPEIEIGMNIPVSEPRYIRIHSGVDNEVDIVQFDGWGIR